MRSPSCCAGHRFYKSRSVRFCGIWLSIWLMNPFTIHNSNMQWRGHSCQSFRIDWKLSKYAFCPKCKLNIFSTFVGYYLHISLYLYVERDIEISEYPRKCHFDIFYWSFVIEQTKAIGDCLTEINSSNAREKLIHFQWWLTNTMRVIRWPLTPFCMGTECILPLLASSVFWT